MRDDWKETKAPAAPQALDPQQQARAPEPRTTSDANGPDDIDELLGDYERRKQDQARDQIQRALQLEQARTTGAEVLRRHVITHARDVVGRLRKSGHRVIYQEALDSYPPNVRVHLYPKAGPMDLSEPKRWTLELTWGDPDPDQLVAQRWTSAGLGEMVPLGSASEAEIDQLWVREHFLNFVRRALELA